MLCSPGLSNGKTRRVLEPIWHLESIILIESVVGGRDY